MRREPLIAVAIIALGFLGVKGFHVYQGMIVDKGAYLAKSNTACDKVAEAMSLEVKVAQSLIRSSGSVGIYEQRGVFTSVSDAFMSATQSIQDIGDVPYGCENIQENFSKLREACERLASDYQAGPSGIESATKDTEAAGTLLVDTQRSVIEAQQASHT